MAGSWGFLGALAAVAWRVGWSGPGRAAGVARAVGPGVAAARTGPDRVGEGLDPARGGFGLAGVAARIRASSPVGAAVAVVWGLVARPTALR